jgi:DNA uptake protein ComE-like DNA-binding protein
MRVLQKEWVSGLLCIGLAAFTIAGCRDAQQFGQHPPVTAKPASSPAGQAAAAPASNDGLTKSAPAAKVEPAKDAPQLKTEAKQAAANTEQAASSLITGIKKEIGADPYPSSGEIVNINYSDEKRILTLPGINHDLAMKIIRNRPYATPTDLMAKHVLTKGEYNRIKSRLTAWDNLWNTPN